MVMLYLAFFTLSEACPPWTTPYISDAEDNTTHCMCGKELDETVLCNNKTLQVSVLRCYCISLTTRI